MRWKTTLKFNFVLLTIILAVALFRGCGGGVTDWLAALFAPNTPRENYAKQLRGDGYFSAAAISAWDDSYRAARSGGPSVSIPHREDVQLYAEPVASAQSLSFFLGGGRELTVRTLSTDGGPFLELYRTDQEGAARGRPVAVADAEEVTLTYTSDEPRGEQLLLLLQDSLLHVARHEIQLTTTPILKFPVAGVDAGAVQSFWGAPRDGGRRRHEGNDIFAPRGTELYAMANGRVTRTGNGGLGGKTVWLWDGERGISYYYAHLDKVLVSKGQILARGDVVGTVGNSGNARTTPPHLHLGIYANGALDPWPYLANPDQLPPAPVYQLPAPGDSTRVPKTGNHYLRRTPERKGKVIRQLRNDAPVKVLGATGRFFRVRTKSGELGWVNFD